MITRIPVVYELHHLPPCGTTWAPRTCRGHDQRLPIDHRCWTWSGWPHICRCMRCTSGTRSAGAP